MNRKPSGDEMKRALITGSEGFIGSHLKNLLESDGYDVWCSTQDAEKRSPALIDRTLLCDVRDAQQVELALRESNPDVIYHLAAQSYPTVSWTDPHTTLDTNVMGTVNIFEAVRRLEIDPIVIVACSSAEYGFVRPDETPVSESHELKPLHPYGVSKVAQDLLTYQYHANYGIRGVRARIFNTTGPGKVNDVVSDFCKRVVEVELGQRERITHGNLDARRDITDVRDMSRALQACENAAFGEAYNLCSNVAYTIEDILSIIIESSTTDVEAVLDPALIRPTDEPIIMGDNTKFKSKTGWSPVVPLQVTIVDTLEFFRDAHQ